MSFFLVVIILCATLTYCGEGFEMYNPESVEIILQRLDKYVRRIEYLELNLAKQNQITTEHRNLIQELQATVATHARSLEAAHRKINLLEMKVKDQKQTAAEQRTILGLLRVAMSRKRRNLNSRKHDVTKGIQIDNLTATSMDEQVDFNIKRNKIPLHAESRSEKTFKRTGQNHGISDKDKTSHSFNRHGPERWEKNSMRPSRNIQRRVTTVPSVAFSGYISHNLHHLGIDHIIDFDQTLLNDGNHYNAFNGIFTCPITGIYLFTFSVAQERQTTLAVKLVIDGVNQVDAVVDPFHADQQLMGGNTAIVRVRKGQTVWIASYQVPDNDITSDTRYRYATFSGVLLYPDQ